MNFKIIFGAFSLGIVMMAGLPSGSAEAQTQCPVGTAAGAVTCGPDAPSQGAAPSGPPRIRERANGIGGYARNIETGVVYSWTGHGNSAEDAMWQALQKCQQPNYNRELSMVAPSTPDAPCEKMTYWQNGCTAVASGDHEGGKRFNIEVRSNARAARADTLSACQGVSENCTIVHDTVCVSRTTRTREVIMLGR